MLLIDGAAWSQERSEEQGDRKTQRELCCLERGEGRHGRRSVELLRGEAPENKHEEPRFLKNGPGVPAGWQGRFKDTGAAGPQESEATRETQRKGRCLERGGRAGGLSSCRGGEAPKNKEEKGAAPRGWRPCALRARLGRSPGERGDTRNAT